MLSRFYIIIVVFIWTGLAFFASGSSFAQVAPQGAVQGGKESAAQSAYTVTPKEMDFGGIGPAEGVKGTFTLKSSGTRPIEWTVSGPDGWILMETQKLSGSLRDKPENLRVHISSLKEALREDNFESKSSFLVQITLESGSRLVSYQKRLTAGAYREMLKLSSRGGTRNIFVRFRLVSAGSGPVLAVEPVRVDLGVVRSGEQAAWRVRVTNKGIGTLKWKTFVPDQTVSSGSEKRRRYISFVNEDIKGSGVYATPSHLKDAMELSGKWSEYSGYPAGNAAQKVLKYRFWGTGISVFFSVEPDGGELTAYVDEKLKNGHECRAGQKERIECMVAEGLMNGLHTLVVVTRGNHAVIEGVGIYGKDIIRVNPGWISVFPDSGTTNRETDFVNITANIQRAVPGYYGESVIFDSNGGQSVIEVSLEVSEDSITKALDVYRYAVGSDYLYTSNPQEDAKIIQNRGYRKQGVAFRLFSPGTPGTTPFYKWYHPVKKVHFYSYDRRGEGRSLKEYVFEGTIGNIGTSRLTNTRALYRWFNPASGGRFYSTDPNGEGHLKKGYRFDGIAGYVR
jgi:hypothetical protein